MKALTLQHQNVGQQLPHTSHGRSLSSNYSPPNLENKYLTGTSAMKPESFSPLVNVAVQPTSCPPLQPSDLCSTSSSLLSSSTLASSLSSPLLSTQNKFLTTNPLCHSFSLTSPLTRDTLLTLTTTSGPLTNRFAQPFSLHPQALGGEKKRSDGEEAKEALSDVTEPSFEETSEQWSEPCDTLSQEERMVVEETDASGAEPLQASGSELVDDDYEDIEMTQEDEFPELDEGNTDEEEQLRKQKYLLLNMVSSSMVLKVTCPGQKTWKSKEGVWRPIIRLVTKISARDPEFILKVALYSRQKLNIRITANFLLALAASLPETKSHVRRYFCATVQLPSDWLEVVRIYETCFKRSLPACLKKAMADKFKQFSEYQLAKYNSRKHRCKHSRNKSKGKTPSSQQLKQWAQKLRSDQTILKKFFQLGEKKATVEKKQSEFNMKKLIKRLHIKEPAQHVMAILGKKYPTDQRAFNRSGLKGEWDPDKAGQRLKLKEPQTWEHLVSLEGNKAATWEKLIDNKSLPFMAMLRNLRNIINAGISEKHHAKILKRLTDKKAVVESRQFPFRFLSAYKVILELVSAASAKQPAMVSNNKILRDIVKKIPKCSRFSRMEWETTKRSRLKATLGVPFVYRMYQAKKAQIKKAREEVFTVSLLDRYCKALETAVQLSCRYNLPPLPGRTVILVCSDSHGMDWTKKLDFCLPADPEEKEQVQEKGRLFNSNKKKNVEETEKFTPSEREVCALLALMIRSCAEDSQLCIMNSSVHCEEAVLKSDVLLDNVKTLARQLKTCQEIRYDTRDTNFITRLFSRGNMVDNIIAITDAWFNSEVEWDINTYRANVNSNVLVTQIHLSQEYASYSRVPASVDTVKLVGFSEQILRFVSERGSSRLLEHVEHLDRLYNIKPAQGTKGTQTTKDVVSIPPSPKLRWQGVRVFISSTFRDMHSERDILVQSVFPELRRRAAPHCLYLQEVELRWGVTEEESERATELCLSEVCRSQMLVAILGERYGQVPDRPVLPDLPQYSWLATAPESLSITEMEIRQFQALYPDVAHERMFCYFRDPQIVKSVPVAWRSHFAPESQDAEQKMTTLKKTLRNNNVKVTDNYTCEWGGVLEGKPHLKKLEDFGKAVLEDLWVAVKKLFVDESEQHDGASEVHEQEVHQGALQRQFFGRSKLLSAAVEIVHQVQTKGHMMVVEGRPGDGKTVFMAGLAEALRKGQNPKKDLNCDVVPYSAAASQSARSTENLLRCLVQLLRRIEDKQDESPLPRSYKDLLAEFHSTLITMKITKPLVLLVDGVDLIRDNRGQLSCDWLPPKLPKGVCLVMSITSKAPLLQTLVKKTGTVLFSLAQLTVPDRREIVKKELDTFGKKLSDSAFSSQLQMLIMKKGAESPLYLRLACQDLRNFASFDRLKETLLGMPQSLSQLVQYSLERLCSHYRDMQGLHWALAVLTVSATGLKERDLYSVLNTCNSLSSHKGEVTWQKILHLSRHPTERVPMAAFTHIVHILQSLIDPSHCHNTSDMLSVENREVRRAFEDILLPGESEKSRAHLILAAHLWIRADPEGQDTFFHCEVNSIMHLPESLNQSGQVEVVESLLSSYFFMYANVRNGLLQHLLEVYNLYQEKYGSGQSRRFNSNLLNCHNFLRCHTAVLSSWPALFIQEALRSAPMTPAHSWAKGLVRKGGSRLVECHTSLGYDPQEFSMMKSTLRSEPTCLALSPNKQLMVVGSNEGMLHFLNVQTGQEAKLLVSNCDGISSCVFLKDGCLATTSFDGRIEVWDVPNGCRTALIDGHNNAITGSNVSADKKHFVTVSLDFMLKVWSSVKSHEVASLTSISPLNCVTFDPEDHLLAAGCWNGNVIVWNWLQNKRHLLLCGHQRSVRSVSFSSSSMLCSGSISGEVRVWSVPTTTCVGCFQAHDGGAEALTFLDEGSRLLTAGSDHTIRLWSGGLGRSVATLKNTETVQEPPQKKRKLVTSGSAALCVAVHGDDVAVGYHLDSIKIFSLDSGEKIQSIDFIELSIHCMLWVVTGKTKKKTEVLVFSGSDKRMRVYKKKEGSLEYVGMFASQSGVVLAMAQSSTYLATASEDSTIALWHLKNLDRDPDVLPSALLKGHTLAVTCVAFSPDGKQLLSGGKDQSLMVWDVSSLPGRLAKPLHHAHRDWINDCDWKDGCVVSCSDDGRLCFWDLEAGQCVSEISWKCPLTSVCCLGEHVIAGCADGGLHVWEWETKAEISHISAHKQRINHCCLPSNTDKTKEKKTGEMTVFTASNDCIVKVWKPLQVEHIATLHGHSGAIQGLALREEFNEIITVSADRSVRMWASAKDYPADQKKAVSVLSYSEDGTMFIAGYESGLVEVWRQHTIVAHKQISDTAIAAATFMPNDQLAVGYIKSLVVDVYRMVWNEEHNNARLVKGNPYKVAQHVVHLFYSSALIGLSINGRIFDLAFEATNTYHRQIHSWQERVRVHAIIRNDNHSTWLVGESDGKVHVGFMYNLGSKVCLNSSFSDTVMEALDYGDNNNEEEEEEEKEEEKEDKGENEKEGDEEEGGDKEQGEEQKTDQEEEEKIEEKEARKVDDEGEDENDEYEDMEDEEDEDKHSQPQDQENVESQEEEEEMEDLEEEDDDDWEEEDEDWDDEEKDKDDEEMENLEIKSNQKQKKKIEVQPSKEKNEEEEEQEEEEQSQEENKEEENEEEEQSQEENKEEQQSPEEEKEEEEDDDHDDDDDEKQKQLKKNETLITAMTKNRRLVVCGDLKGNMWFNLPSEILSWSKKKKVHSDRITQLRLTDTTIISASLDRTVKLWDRNTKKQVGMFVCEGPVLNLEVNPSNPTELVCGDGNGLIYILSWKE